MLLSMEKMVRHFSIGFPRPTQMEKMHVSCRIPTAYSILQYAPLLWLVIPAIVYHNERNAHEAVYQATFEEVH